MSHLKNPMMVDHHPQAQNTDRPCDLVVVVPVADQPFTGGSVRVRVGQQSFPCAVGKQGFVRTKREGDHATPVGVFPLRQIFLRHDRVDSAIVTLAESSGLPVNALSPRDGWCDTPDHPAYNRWVDLTTLPSGVGHECLYRQDHLYDIILVVGHNDDPPVPWGGSAIFVHVADEGFEGTEGCVALTLDDLRVALGYLRPDSRLVVRWG